MNDIQPIAPPVQEIPERARGVYYTTQVIASAKALVESVRSGAGRSIPVETTDEFNAFLRAVSEHSSWKAGEDRALVVSRDLPQHGLVNLRWVSRSTGAIYRLLALANDHPDCHPDHRTPVVGIFQANEFPFDLVVRPMLDITSTFNILAE